MSSTMLDSAALRADPTLLDAVFERLRGRVAAADPSIGALAIGDAEGEIRSATFASRGAPPAADSNFFLASLTKPVFAAAFLQLVEDGLIGLHEPIGRHMAEFAHGDKAKVTSWHLLTHTSGVPDIDPDLIRRTRPSAAQMTQLTLAAPLDFEPGSRWQYCSASFYLLGLLIERLSGMSYARYLDDRLLEPLGLGMTFDARRGGRPIVPVEGTGADNRVLRWLLLRYMARAAVPGGGFFGSLGDLVRFGAAMLRPRTITSRPLPLAPATIEQMGADQTHGLIGTVDGEQREIHFGLSWAKPTLMHEGPGSARAVAHSGATGTRLWLDPDASLVFVFLANRWSGNRSAEIEALGGTYAAMKRGAGG
jgi:CubicO group peptidase (beta-lactamase class C family)